MEEMVIESAGNRASDGRRYLSTKASFVECFLYEKKEMNDEKIAVFLERVHKGTRTMKRRRDVPIESEKNMRIEAS